VGLKNGTKPSRKWALGPDLVLGVSSFLQGFAELLGYLITSNHVQGCKKHHYKLQISLGKCLTNEETNEDLTPCKLIGQ